jgi:two-component system, LytTR family, sensor kinase
MHIFARLLFNAVLKLPIPVIKILPGKKRFRFRKLAGILFTIFMLWYVVGTILYHAVPELFIKADYNNIGYLLNILKEYVFHTVFFYCTLNVYYSLVAGKKPFARYLAVSLATGIVYVAYMLFKDYNFHSPLLPKATTGVLIYGYSFSVLVIVGLNLLVAYLAHLRDEKKQRAILEDQKLQLEIEKSHANYNFLKAQINPHFLHNTLNFLYARSLPYSPELSEGILTLSEIMRYALSDNNVKDGKAPLKDEIEHLRNVIRIHQLRYNNNLQVHFEVNGIVNGAVIIPFVLITIVENAFKHGDLKSVDCPIDIRLTVEHHSLRFYCRNKKKTGPKELSTGIGLDNIKKRLDHAYKDQYMLDIKDEHQLYTTQLTIHTL